MRGTNYFLKTIAIVATALLVTSFLPEVRAADPPLVDTIHLKNGGILYGNVTEVEENRQRFWVVKTVDGVQLKLKRSQVARISKPSAELLEYASLKQTMANTVDAHWKMQKWCLDNRLKRQREYHLLKVIELDPDHKDARSRLGYKDHNGIWVHWEQFQANQGYHKDTRGVYRLPIAMEMDERKKAYEKVESDWNKKIRNLMTKVIKRQDAAALAQLKAIKDPAAVPGLMEAYKKNGDFGIRRTIIEVLGQIESAASQNALVQIATMTPDSELNLAESAVTELKQDHFRREGICNSVLHWLRPSPASRLDKRVLVHRAAWLIGHMKYEPAIRPLIDALNTVHQVPTGAPSGNANVGANDDGAGLSWGPKAKFRPQPFQNQPVYDALRILSPGGVDFQFNEAAWTDWYISQNSLRSNQLGRDN